MNKDLNENLHTRSLWPKGKYNYQRIDGFEVRVHLHVLKWRWRPLVRWNLGAPVFVWLCLTVRATASYEPPAHPYI